MKNVKPLNPRQLHAIKLLAAGTPDYVVAQRIEISTMTLYRWKRQDTFNQELRRITYFGLEDFSKKLNESAVTALDTLQEVMNDLREPSTHRSKVALGIINAMPKVHDALSRSVRHSGESIVMEAESEDVPVTFQHEGVTVIGVDEPVSMKC